MLITTLVVSFLVCCRLEVRCGSAGVVSGLQSEHYSSLGRVYGAGGRVKMERDGTRAETRFGLPAKRASPFFIGGGVSSVEYWLSWSAGRGRTIVVTLDGLFRVKLAIHSIRLLPLHFPSRASPCATRFHFHSTVRHHSYRTHDLHSGSQDHHPSQNTVQKTTYYNSASNAPDDGRMYPKHVELRIR